MARIATTFFCRVVNSGSKRSTQVKLRDIVVFGRIICAVRTVRCWQIRLVHLLVHRQYMHAVYIAIACGWGSRTRPVRLGRILNSTRRCTEQKVKLAIKQLTAARAKKNTFERVLPSASEKFRRRPQVAGMVWTGMVWYGMVW